MEKICPHCGKAFLCLHDNILKCDCAKIKLSPQSRNWIYNRYGNLCLCVSCLRKIEEELPPMSVDRLS